MIGKIFLLTACCCASLLSVSASEESQDTLSTTLHDEMKQIANLITYLTKEEGGHYFENMFKSVNMPSDCSRDALKALKDILVVLKEEIPFETSLFDKEVLRELEIQDQDQIFKSLLERVPLIKTMLTEFNAFLNDNPQRLLADKNGEVTKYYKKHISAKDANVKDYTFLVKFCNDYLDSESPFMKMYKAFNTYEELLKKMPSKTPSPTSSPQATPGAKPAAPNTSESAGGQPQQETPENRPSQAPSPQSPPQTEQSTSNLNGPSKSASFTFGGMTVATLCYFVLSAF
uniref:Merozoite surface antigen-2b (MSA-2b) n=1 Tax=Babesia bovis TaxID=5865 RepID=S6BH94_BABBO|nr:merozoite surface antigen-2b (MSA-2b) [Babesia bovis]